MIEAAMIWNEPNNKSHWDPELDPDWTAFGRMAALAGQAIAAEAPGLLRVLGGISPIDPAFIVKLQERGVLDHLDVVALHGFPLDWNLVADRRMAGPLKEIQAVTNLPIWVTEVGVSTFGAEEVQEFGLQRTADLLIGRVPRIHWYSLYDLPRAWEATTRHREAEGSSYYRHFYMGLLREDGSPKLAMRALPRIHARHGHLPVVPFRGPPAGRCRTLAARTGCTSPADGVELGRQLPPRCAGVVRPPDAGAGGIRGDGDVLLHAGASRAGPTPHQPASGAGRVRGVLRYDDQALRGRRAPVDHHSAASRREAIPCAGVPRASRWDTRGGSVPRWKLRMRSSVPRSAMVVRR